MNRFRVEQYLRQRLHDMTDAHLRAVQEDVCAVFWKTVKAIEEKAGKSFAVVCAERIADHVRRNPSAVPG